MRPLTAEGIVAAQPDLVLLMTKAAWSRPGGVDGLLDRVPALAQTPAGQHRRFVDMDDSQILGFGPLTADVLNALARRRLRPGGRLDDDRRPRRRPRRRRSRRTLGRGRRLLVLLVVGVVALRALRGRHAASFDIPADEVLGSVLHRIGLDVGPAADPSAGREHAVAGAVPARGDGDARRRRARHCRCADAGRVRQPARRARRGRRLLRCGGRRGVGRSSSAGPSPAPGPSPCAAFADRPGHHAARLRALPRRRPHRGRDARAHRHRGQRDRQRRHRLPDVPRRPAGPRGDRLLDAGQPQRLALGARRRIVFPMAAVGLVAAILVLPASSTCSRSATGPPGTSASTSSGCG